MLESFFYEYFLHFKTISNKFQQYLKNFKFSTATIMVARPLWFKSIMVKVTILYDTHLHTHYVTHLCTHYGTHVRTDYGTHLRTQYGTDHSIH